MVSARAVLAFLIVVSVLFGCGGTGQQAAPPVRQVEQLSANAGAEASVRDLVEEFGRRLQLVSLLAPADEVRATLQAQYGELVAPDLLARWQEDLTRAPGRLTSSPWPDRVEIERIEKTADGSYKVEGYIIQVTSTEQAEGGAAARDPVSLTVSRVGDRWLITKLEQRVRYEDSTYGFRFSLPGSWRGYTIVNDQWQGFAVGNGAGDQPAASGPQIAIRHPGWTEETPRQDIPIMIFTIQQWEDLQEGKFHIGAAPTGPIELGRNSQYVFALPARYNYAFLPGHEEVEEILAGNPLETFEPEAAE